MSSPAPRRSQRSSQAGTPRRAARSSQALPSSPPDPSAAQLLGEHAMSSQSQASSARGSRRAPVSSSPMPYQSSPAPSGGDRTPMNDVAMTDGDRTPRASGNMMNGNTSHKRYLCTTDSFKNHLQSVTHLHRAQEETFANNQRQTLKPLAFSSAPHARNHQAAPPSITPDVEIFIRTVMQALLAQEEESLLMRVAMLSVIYLTDPMHQPFPTTTQPHPMQQL